MTSYQVKLFLYQLCNGINYCHARRIMHRDLKPQNLLIDRQGTLKIADFGLAKVIPNRAKSYSFCGSPEYMCPEMLAGSGHDRKVDIYCLGAPLYEMLTGLPPFYNKDTEVMYQKII